MRVSRKLRERLLHACFGSIPLIVAGLLLVPLLRYDLADTRKQLIWRAKEALAKSDKSTAEFCFERLRRLGSGADRSNFTALVEIAEGLGDDERIDSLVKHLAPRERPVLAAAHLLRARRLLAFKAGLTPEIADEAQIHLGHVIDLGGQTAPVADHLIGQLYDRRRRFEEAEFHLSRAARAKVPGVELDLVKLYARWSQSLYTRNPKRAKALRETGVALARRLLVACKAACDVDPRSVHAARNLAHVQITLGQFGPAVGTLKRMARNHPAELAATRNLLASVYYQWSLRQVKQPERRFELLMLAFQASEGAINEVLIGLVQFSQMKGAEGRKALELLNGALADGKSVVMIHQLLGVAASGRGDQTQARFHLETASRLVKKGSARAVELANSLAYVLAISPQPDLKRALELSSWVLEQQPDVLMYRGTRGHILGKMGRWREAVPDLEYAAPADPDKRRVHLTLATAYHHLGMMAQRDQHVTRARAAGAVIPALLLGAAGEKR